MLAAVFAGWTLGGAEQPPAVILATEAVSGPKTLIIHTSRRGGHHVMRAAVIGPNNRPQLVSFLVDTGATSLVLPVSMIDRLGFQFADLKSIQIQTANGIIAGTQGVLKSVQLGGPDNNDVIERITVQFVDDAAIGGQALMGMNVLSRYSITIEDKRDQIVLVKQR